MKISLHDSLIMSTTIFEFGSGEGFQSVHHLVEEQQPHQGGDPVQRVREQYEGGGGSAALDMGV